MVTMNKEDHKEQVLTFPAWLAPLIPDLMLTPQGLVMHHNKNDWLVFDASFMPSETSITYNSLIDVTREPIITLAQAWWDHLVHIYNLWISFPDSELYMAKDNAAGAFCQPKYHPNIINVKAFIIGHYLFVPTSKTFDDQDRPSNWEPITHTRQALSKEYSNGHHTILPFPEYMDNVCISMPPHPPQPYTPVYQDKFNPVLVSNSIPKDTTPLLTTCTWTTTCMQPWVSPRFGGPCVAALPGSLACLATMNQTYTASNQTWRSSSKMKSVMNVAN